MDKIEKLLNRDTITETKKILGGKHWSEFNDEENAFMLGKAFVDGVNKKEHLKSIGDTYFGIPWEDFINHIEHYGFKKAFSQFFKGSEGEEEEVIYYYKGFVIHAESFSLGEKHINGGYLYIMLEDTCEGRNDLFHLRGSSSYNDGEYMMSFDIREGLMYKISQLEKLPIVTTWSQKHTFLHFNNYMDCKGLEYPEWGKKVKAITAEKISKCCDEFKELVGDYYG